MAASTPCSARGCPSRRASSTTSTSFMTSSSPRSARCGRSSSTRSSHGRPGTSWCFERAGRAAGTSVSTSSPSWRACWRPAMSSTSSDPRTRSMRSETVRSIIRAYDDPVVRAYCWVRFGILRQRFLDEIGQYLPEDGPVLDIGCGLGLFSLYYAATAPRRLVRGLDVNGRRIALARRAAVRLGIDNVAYAEGDARDFKGDTEVAGAYMLDIVHHVPPPTVA